MGLEAALTQLVVGALTSGSPVNVVIGSFLSKIGLGDDDITPKEAVYEAMSQVNAELDLKLDLQGARIQAAKDKILEEE